jgi:hypothetical protein
VEGAPASAGLLHTLKQGAATHGAQQPQIPLYICRHGSVLAVLGIQMSTSQDSDHTGVLS